MKLRDLFRSPEKEVLENVRAHLAAGATIRATNPMIPTLQIDGYKNGVLKCRGELTIEYPKETV